MQKRDFKRRRAGWLLTTCLFIAAAAPGSSLVVTTIATGAATGAEQVVQVTGQATISTTPAAARQQALNDALRQAVEQVMGAYISSSSTLRTTDAFEDLQQRLMKRSDGFGRVTQVLQESQSGGIYTVTVRVAVSRPSLEKELKAFLTLKGDPRIIVAIPESILRRVVPDPAAETEIQRSLIAAGYRVIDLKQAELNALRDVTREGTSGQALRELRTRYQADLLVTGEAFAEEYGNVLGQRAYSARLELKIVDLATAQVIYSDAFTGTGVGNTDAVAGKTALQNVARTAAPALPGSLLSWLSGNGKAAGRTFTVRIQGLPSFSALNTTLATLRNTASVTTVLNRHFDAAGALVEVEYSGAPEELAVLLEQLGFVVTSVTAGEITVAAK